MRRINSADKIRSVHPQIRQIYKIRLLYSILSIPPLLAALYETGRGFPYFGAYCFGALIWPHLALLLSCFSHDPKRAESRINHRWDSLLIGVWVPIVHFNPMILILTFIIAGLPGIIRKSVIFWRFASFFMSIGIGTAIYGFHFDKTPSLLTTACTGVAIVLFSSITSLLVYQTTKQISSTRQALKIQKKEIEQALIERNKAYAALNDDLRIAESYVRKMLPVPIKEEHIQTDWLFVPSSRLGGDAFGYHWLDAEHFAFYLLDVSGHGVGAALLSVSVLDDLRSQSLKAADFTCPRCVLEALNIAFPGDKHDDMFITIWYGVFHKHDRILRYASAGHPPAILLDDGQSNPPEMTLLKNPNSAVGVVPEMIFHENQIPIPNGNALYVFSDGVYEIRQRDGSMWRFDEFREQLTRFKPGKPSRIEQVYEHVTTLNRSASLDDDFSIMEIVFR